MIHDRKESLAYAKHLLAEHRRVHGLIDRIDEKWSLTPEPLQNTHAIEDLLASLKQLREELARHFQEEEAGGVMEEAAARCPDLGQEIVHLEEEHATLLGNLDRIIAGMRTASQFGLVPGEVGQEFHQFAEALKAHEAAERRVLEQGFGVEIS